MRNGNRTGNAVRTDGTLAGRWGHRSRRWKSNARLAMATAATATPVLALLVHSKSAAAAGTSFIVVQNGSASAPSTYNLNSGATNIPGANDTIQMDGSPTVTYAASDSSALPTFSVLAMNNVVNTGGTAVFNMTGGVLSIGTVNLGTLGSGTSKHPILNVLGGTLTITSNIVPGGAPNTFFNVSGSTAVVNYAGTLSFGQSGSSGTEYINVTGGGTFNYSGASATMGSSGADIATINVSNGWFNSSSASNAFTLGSGTSSSTGQILVTGGVFNETGASSVFKLATTSATTGLIQVTSGTFNDNGTSASMSVGAGNGANGSIVVNGGTFNQTGGSSTLNVANAVGATGTVNITNGTYNFGGSNNITIGGSGTATNVATGTVVVGSGGKLNLSTTSASVIYLANGPYTAGNLILNDTGTLSAPKATLAVGQYDAGNGSAGSLALGTFTMNGSSSATLAGVRVGGNNAGSTVNGIVNLNGGVLTTGGVLNTAGTNLPGGPSATQLAVNANGGTVVASFNSSTNSNFFGGTYLDLLAGGLTFNTASNAVTITNSIHGNGAFTKVGTAALNLSGGSDYSGGTFINQGTVIAGNQGAFGSGNVTLANVSGGLVKLASNNTALQVSALVGGGSAGGNVDLNSQLLFVGANNATTSTYSGAIVDTGITSPGTVGKYYSNTQVFAGNSTYTGTTTVNGGVLRADAPQILVAGSLTSSSTGLGQVNVTNGGTLAGVGGVGDVAIVSGGTITAGSGATHSDTIGNLSSGTQNWSNGSYSVKLNGSLAIANGTNVTGDGSSDVLLMSGLSSASTGLSVTPVLLTAGSALDPTMSYQFVIAESTSTAFTPGVLSTLTVTPGADTPAGFNYSFSDNNTISGGSGVDDLILDLTPAPEPTSLLLAAIAGAPLVLGRRRRRA